VPYLERLFPGATFVFLRRRGADNVSSLMEGWRARPRFVRYRLPEELTGLGELSGNPWSFVLVPGWRELRAASLEEICAHQYVECNGAVIAARTASTARWIDLGYEELVASPVDELRCVYTELGLAFTDRVETFARGLAERASATSLTAPQPEKWREQNEEAILRVAPQLAETERRLGYAA
jgi:hypothetical protein